MHAKGIVVTGTFIAAANARSVSRATHLQGGAIPVTVRFSDGAGVPNISDTHPNAGLRGHPRSLKFIVDNQPLPVSFATLAYFGNKAFVFVDGTATNRTDATRSFRSLVWRTSTLLALPGPRLPICSTTWPAVWRVAPFGSGSISSWRTPVTRPTMSPSCGRMTASGSSWVRSA